MAGSWWVHPDAHIHQVHVSCGEWVEGSEILTPDEARKMAKELLEAADAAEGKP